MPLTDYTSGRIAWSDLPLWRRVAVVCCLGMFVYLGQGDAYEHIKIYYSAPNSPVGEQKYPIDVMHGSLRYVTQSELQRILECRDRANLVGIPFIAAFVLLATSKKFKPIRQPIL